MIKNEKKRNISNVITIENNKIYFFKCQIKQAEKARKLLYAIGLPTYKELKRLIEINGLRDSPITSQDVAIAEKIYQKKISSLKGNTTKRKPNRIIDPTITVPPDIREIHQTITFVMDIIRINNCYFLTTISNNLFYRTVHYLTRITGHELSTALNEALQPYQKAGYNIHTIKADNKFKRMFSSMNDMNINMQFCNPDDHVPEAECNNLTIKERCRTMYYRLPFNQLPKSFLIQLV